MWNALLQAHVAAAGAPTTANSLEFHVHLCMLRYTCTACVSVACCMSYCVSECIDVFERPNGTARIIAKKPKKNARLELNVERSMLRSNSYQANLV